MKESFYMIEKKEAIELVNDLIGKLQKIKKSMEDSDEEYINMSSIDYDKGVTYSPMRRIPALAGIALIEDAKTIFFNEDPLCPYLNLHSIKQPDVEKIIKAGQVTTLLLIGKGVGENGSS